MATHSEPALDGNDNYDLKAYETQTGMIPILTRKEIDKLTTITADLLDHEPGSPEREAVIHSLNGEAIHELETKDPDSYSTMADFIEASREARRLAANIADVEIAEDGSLIDHADEHSS